MSVSLALVDEEKETLTTHITPSPSHVLSCLGLLHATSMSGVRVQTAREQIAVIRFCTITSREMFPLLRGGQWHKCTVQQVVFSETDQLYAKKKKKKQQHRNLAVLDVCTSFGKITFVTIQTLGKPCLTPEVRRHPCSTKVW